MPRKKNNLSDEELRKELKDSAPSGLRAFLLHENVIEGVISKRKSGGHTVKFAVRNEKYGFRDMPHARSLITFLNHAWTGRVDIVTDESEASHMEVTFKLR